MGTATPSYHSGFYSPKRGNVPKYPSLWRGCVGAWCGSLGQTGSMIPDWSVNSNTMSMVSSMSSATGWSTTPGMWNSLFDGVNDGFGASPPSYSRSEFSACAWIKRSVAPVANMTPVILGHYNNDGAANRAWLMCTANTTWNADGVPDGNEFAVAVSPDGTFTTPKVYWVDQNLFDDRPHHVGFYFYKGSLQLFVDGTQRITNKQNDTFFDTCYTTTKNVAIGILNPEGVLSSPWIGNIDDCRLYNRLLSPAEFALLARRPRIAYELDRRRKFRAIPATSFNSANKQLIGSWL